MRTLLIGCACAALLACSDSGSPESQVRETLSVMEQAAEARDVGELMDHFADDYRDGYGQGRDELRRYIQGYFIANQSIHLLTRIDSLDFPHADEARLKVTIGMTGREADATSAWDLAADLQVFEATLRKQGSDWKVIYASRTAAN